MKSDVKKKWIDALRSGDYKQTTHVLRKGNSYCCLGVLCDVMDCKWEKDTECYVAHYDNDSEYSILPNTVMKEVHIHTDEEIKLTNMNDSGADFDEIADWIEENL